MVDYLTVKKDPVEDFYEEFVKRIFFDNFPGKISFVLCLFAYFIIIRFVELIKAFSVP